MSTSEDTYLELSDNPVRFEAVNQLVNVFFDDSNKQVFTVRSGGVMGVIVKGPTEESKLYKFRTDDSSPVISIKFSLDQTVLAVQRNKTSVEFMNVVNDNLDVEYSQSCKKNSVILGFVWTQINEVALVTDHGIEMYTVIPDKKSIKHIKTTSVNVNWFVWCAQNKIALLSSQHGSHLLPVVFKPGSIQKLSRVETEPGRMALERDVTLATLYGTPAVLILRHQTNNQTAEVHIHTLNGPGMAPVKSHVLRIGASGRFAINVVDNLVIVHHQATKCSQLFDISLPGETDGTVVYHTNVAAPKSFKSASLNLPGLVEPQKHICELYSPNWVVFQPNIVIDAKLGCLWYINLNLESLCNHIPDLSVCTQLLLKRTDADKILLKVLLQSVKQSKPPLKKIQESFNHINLVYRNWVEADLQSQTASPANAPILQKSSNSPSVLIDQNSMYYNVFQELDNNEDLGKLEWVLISYITSLSEYGIPTQYNINELLVTTLVRRNKFTNLQQLLQYGVVNDSKPLACLLLSLGNMHPAASQLALDMLTRLGALEEMQEVLLSQGEVLLALKLAGNNASPRKFLEAAINSNDGILFHNILKHVQSNPRFNSMFLKDDYLSKYKNMFSTTE